MRVIVCADAYAEAYFSALKGLNHTFEIAGLMAENTDANRKFAERCQTQLYTDIDALPDKIDLGIIARAVPFSLGGCSTVAEQFIERGIHVYQEEPVQKDILIHLMKKAKKNSLCYRVGKPYLRLPAMQAFCSCMKKVLEDRAVYEIGIDADLGICYSIIYLLMNILPKARSLTSLNFKEVSSGRYVVFGEMGDIPFQFQTNALRHSPFPVLHRIIVNTDRGSLSLNGSQGPIFWEEAVKVPLENLSFRESRQYISSFVPSCQLIWQNQAHSIGKFVLQEWPSAIREELLQMELAMQMKRQDAVLAQKEILCAGNWEAILGNTYSEHFEGRREAVKHDLWNPAVLKYSINKKTDLTGEELISYCESLEFDFLSLCVEQRAQTLLVTMLHFLQEKGLFLSADTSYRAEEIIQKVGVASEHEHVLLRWIDVLSQKGFLTFINGKYSYTAKVTEEQVKRGWKEMAYLWDYRLSSPKSTEYLQNNVRSLSSLMDGSQKATLLLFPEGRLDFADSLYKETVILQYCNHMIARTVTDYIKKKEEDKREGKHNRLKVLEIGAGTGATTDTILSHLSQTPYIDRVEYLFSDVSSFFLQAAQKRYEVNLPVTYQIIDINSDLDGQGLEKDSMEVIVAVGVLNNARETNHAVAALLKILRKGGILLIAETVAEVLDILVSQAFMMEKPEDVRKGENKTFLSAEVWRKILNEQGKLIGEYPKDGHPLNLLGQKLFVVGKKEKICI
ncbi:bifunctional Gfo/Idh/MocA family oxidoreductase/class I SAM-dependent methyltransferase [Sinanaerobacter sp. ZZT-01]|uniref:bifunctional Gfo/Idh/MocA family oxidoreductase/class I SAM-dependent methyltransferase n=1 Tax=Sinanaerobacter sp. ZZT-01 TaxID=3111540 RepID=UPI002D7732C2|nr:bifunctional Gfo/Idh/MocA family oxidoreductase/class I SAM-dependent methyltransferase [Sinanaerobacter sp. ZZT-01]WRR94943.1 bifunctional Gfo/Idh/MocA family oxidoreductase/class I SAM-dependent methyltransferase [Sinanaerobacter sp. ZZT-01]